MTLGDKNQPLISVIIPAHNSSATIEGAIRSMLNQTYKNLEIIVIDDNSEDSTKEVVEKFKGLGNVFYYPLRYDDPERFNEQGRNINAGWIARNYGFEKAQGQWITFQDADDVSLLNRIETEYELALKYDSNHVCIDWQKFDPSLSGKKLDFERILKDHPDAVMNPKEIEKLRQRTKGIAMSLFGNLHSLVPFRIKQLRFINKLFFRSLDPYPCAGNSPLFKREILEKVKFRKRDHRVWPTFVGRGADRDFNFQVAETFKKSFAFKIPLYLWRVKNQNEKYDEYEKYLT
ncbi:MAG: glycosyltransferase family 2 protein [bacterium]|nr:glycosyltransferase family 2 protein [bacterium]